jgi:AcrR family transcriptional regulator
LRRVSPAAGPADGPDPWFAPRTSRLAVRGNGAAAAGRVDPQAATRLLATEGLSALSVRRLSADVGVSSRAVYSVFGGMTGVLGALYRRAADVMNQHHEAVPRQDDPLAEIAELAFAYRRGALAQRDLYGLYLERAVPSFCPSDDDIAYAMRAHTRAQEAFGRACAAFAPASDPAFLTRQAWALLHGLSSLEIGGLLGGADEADTTWRAALDAMLRGLFPSGATSRPVTASGTRSVDLPVLGAGPDGQLGTC